MLLYELVNDLYKNRLILLAKDLGHDYENLPGRSRSVKAKSLVESLATQRRLLDLFLRLEQDFPREPLSDYFYELVAGRFHTRPAGISPLLTALGLDIDEIRELEELAENPMKWLKDTARGVQRKMVETDQWTEFLTTYADFDNTVKPDRLEQLFPLDPGHQAGQRGGAKEDKQDENTECFLPFLHLDYNDQVDFFEECGLAEINAFVIYGLPDEKQQTSLRLLLKKLLNRVPQNTSRINFTPNSVVANDANGVWYEIAHSVGIDTNILEFPVSEGDQDDIVAVMHGKVTAGQYVLILERLNDNFTGDLLENFWEPFTRKLQRLQQEEAQEAPENLSSNGSWALSKVLLFLVDTEGLLKEATIAKANLEHFAPVELPRVETFKDRILRDWKRIAFDHPHCDERLKNFMSTQHWVQKMVDPPVGDGRGVKPEIALRYVCKVCQYDFGGTFIEWLKGESKIEN